MKQPWSAVPGTTPAEKLKVLGMEESAMVDIRRLDEVARRYGVMIYLFFEEDLARNSPLESVMEQYRGVPIYERPFISVEDFLRFTRENDPTFEQTLKEFPLMVEIVSSGTLVVGADGGQVPVVTGVMPFLDELDMDAPPPEPVYAPFNR